MLALSFTSFLQSQPSRGVVHYNAQAPNVYAMVMALLPLLQDLGGDVVRGAAESGTSYGLHVSSGHHQGSEAKVANLSIHPRVEKDVAHLQVTVDDSFTVHVFDSTRNLDGVEAHFGFGETFSPLDHIHERAVGTEFKDEVCGLLKAKCAEEVDDILVLHLGVYLQLGLKLKRVGKGQGSAGYSQQTPRTAPSRDIPSVPSWAASCSSQS